MTNRHAWLAAIAVAALIVACNGSGSSVPVAPDEPASKAPAVRSTQLHHHTVRLPRAQRETRPRTTYTLSDGGFESDTYTYWQQCGDVNAKITSTLAHGGSYSDMNGLKTVEVSGYEGLCQEITVPANGRLTFWVYEGSTETDTNVADQEADLLDSSGNDVTTMFVENHTSTGWEQRTYDLSAYAGKSVWLFFGVYGSGKASNHVYQYVDDVAWAGSATPTPKPSATPTAKPTATASSKPTATPTSKPTATPTSKPTATPTSIPSGKPTPFPTPAGSGPHGTRCGTSCGVERWHIKTVDDPQEHLIDWNPVLANVSTLTSIPVPAGYSSSNDSTRYAPTETQVYRVRAILVGWKTESDHDYHIVIADINSASKTMIVEPPDPACSDACDSGFGSIFTAVRSKLTNCFGAVTSTFTNFPAGVVVDLTGVPYFDPLHGQTGVAPNGIELHPLLGVTFVSGQPSNCSAAAVRGPQGSVVTPENVRAAYEVGRKLAARDRFEEREHRTALARLMTVQILRARESDDRFHLSLRVANNAAKSVDGFSFGLIVDDAHGRRLGTAEVRVRATLAPGAVRALSVAVPYVRFASDTGTIVEATRSLKTYDLDLDSIDYADGTQAGIDD